MLNGMLRLAHRRLLAACATPAPPLAASGRLVAAFAAFALAVGARSGVLRLKVERRPMKWLEVRRAAAAQGSGSASADRPVRIGCARTLRSVERERP
jgi:hypothetical protein